VPLHNRCSIRYKEFDYAESGGYFITICTHKRQCLFGEVRNDEIVLNQLGNLVKNAWLETEKLRDNVTLDVFSVMPNHFHAIIILNGRGTMHRAPTSSKFGQAVADSLSTIVGCFKADVSRNARRLGISTNVPIWQRNFYDHIIRNERDLVALQNYVFYNHLNWYKDELYYEICH